MIELSPKWLAVLADKPETGMGYQVVSVILTDGRRFNQVAIVEGRITQIRGLAEIPFTEEQIAQIVLTHNKWNFNAVRQTGGREREDAENA